jgi:hypothetical protein
MLRRILPALAVAWAAVFVVLPGSAQAQVGLLGAGGVDPFSLYFGYYLPHQAAIAAQSTPLDTINQITAARQFQAVTDRAGLYDPISPYGEEDLDPSRPLSARRKGERMGPPRSFAVSTANARGLGPELYYNRTARYFPQLRTGRGPNRNLAAVRTRSVGSFGGGAPSMPSMPSMPGVR